MFLEVVIVCVGIYGEGVYFGYVGKLCMEFIFGVSFNVGGYNGCKFLLFVLWDFVIWMCVLFF